MVRILANLINKKFFPSKGGDFAVRCVVEHNGEILLIKNRIGSNGKWSLPGGGIESGETIEAAAARELFEETSIRADKSNMRYIGQVLPPADHFRKHIWVMTLSVPTKDVKVNGYEVTAYKWVKPSRFLQDISPVAQNALTLWSAVPIKRQVYTS